MASFEYRLQIAVTPFLEECARAMRRTCGLFDRLLYTDEQYIALVWRSIERSWAAAGIAWLRGTP